MKFPKRTERHISESASWKILQKSLPAEWIIREVSERDYGIDCYVEIVGQDHHVTGDLCSLQLKGTDGIEWKDSSSKWGRRARFSGISKSTVNYWMGLPVPVFLMWAELDTGKLFFASVKQQVRSQYPAYLDTEQHTLGFDFYSDFRMDSKKGELLFFVHYLKERSYKQFSSYLTGLLIHWNEYYEFIVENQNRDCFLEVENETQLLLRHVYDTCRFLSQFLGVEWNVVDLVEAYKSDRERWKDSCCTMHEMTLDRILRELEPVYVKVLEGARELVIERQKDYWMRKDWLLYTMCLNVHTEHMRSES